MGMHMHFDQTCHRYLANNIGENDFSTARPCVTHISCPGSVPCWYHDPNNVLIIRIDPEVYRLDANLRTFSLDVEPLELNARSVNTSSGNNNQDWSLFVMNAR
jgi:hypothetical protein